MLIKPIHCRAIEYPASKGVKILMMLKNYFVSKAKIDVRVTVLKPTSVSFYNRKPIGICPKRFAVAPFAEKRLQQPSSLIS